MLSHGQKAAAEHSLVWTGHKPHVLYIHIYITGVSRYWIKETKGLLYFIEALPYYLSDKQGAAGPGLSCDFQSNFSVLLLPSAGKAIKAAAKHSGACSAEMGRGSEPRFVTSNKKSGCLFTRKSS